MHARERIIRERFARRACADCGHLYTPADVLVLARRRSAWIVLVTCGYCDRRGIFVVTFPRGAPGPGEQWEPKESPIVDLPVDNLKVPGAPITSDDVASMREFLGRFDGNFQRIFA